MSGSLKNQTVWTVKVSRPSPETHSRDRLYYAWVIGARIFVFFITVVFSIVKQFHLACNVSWSADIFRIFQKALFKTLHEKWAHSTIETAYYLPRDAMLARY